MSTFKSSKLPYLQMKTLAYLQYILTIFIMRRQETLWWICSKALAADGISKFAETFTFLTIHLPLTFYWAWRLLVWIGNRLSGLAGLAISPDDFHSLWQGIGETELEKTESSTFVTFRCC